jgi:hypothetical protein
MGKGMDSLSPQKTDPFQHLEFLQNHKCVLLSVNEGQFSDHKKLGIFVQLIHIH